MNDNDKETTAVMVAPRVTGTQIEQWGEREIVRELVSRMMKFHPAASEVGEAGMLAAAQLSVMVGASPLPGLNEIHIWKDRGGKIHVDPGVNYYRRRSREVGGGVRWLPDGKPRPMTLSEKADYSIPEGQPAAICTGMRSDDFDKYWAQGIRFPDIWTISAVTGIAISSAGEAKSGRPAIWTAIKRAEVDLLRQLYPNLEQPQDTVALAREALQRMAGPQADYSEEAAHEASVILFGPEENDWDAGVFESNVDEDAGEIVEPEPEPQEEPERDPNARPWSAERLREYMQTRAAKLTRAASDKQITAAVASLGNITGNDDAKRHSITAYLFGVTSCKDLTSGQASALIDWIAAKPPEYQPSAFAIDEAERVIRARVVELGQTEMGLEAEAA